MSFKTTLAATAARFAKNEAGSFAVPFALGLSVLLAGTGYAIDLSMQVKGKSEVQDVADIASLAAAKQVDANQAELDAIAADVFNAHFGVGGNALVDTVTRDGDAVTVLAQGSVPTTFSRLFGIDEMLVNVASTATYSERKLDIALVLDTTDSMSGQKMADLKVAAGSLIDTIEDLDGDTVRLSVTPFSQHVNIGTGRRNAEWLDVPADREVDRWERVEGSARDCGDRPRGDRDGVAQGGTYYACDYDWVVKGTRTETWKGCVGSRQNPLDVKAAYDGDSIPGLLNKPCGSEIQALTSNMANVRGSVNALTTQGNTYLPSGLLWGWRQLEPSAPLVNTDPAPKEDRILVLMTDGENTKSKRNGEDGHWGNSKGQADKRTRDLCDAVKSGKVTVYTIAFQVTDGSTRNLLQDCASSTANYFNAQNAQDLNAAFDAIGDSVKGLRVTS